MFALLFGINYTEIDQSQSSIIYAYIISSVIEWSIEKRNACYLTTQLWFLACKYYLLTQVGWDERISAILSDISFCQIVYIR